MPDGVVLQPSSRKCIRAIGWLSVGFALCLPGTARAGDPKAFKVPSESFLPGIRRIAIYPTLPVDAPQRPRAQRTFDSLLVAALADFGWQVLPPWEVEIHRTAARDSMDADLPGGPRQLIAVRRDSVRTAMLNDEVRRRIREAFRPDATVQGAIYSIDARVIENVATWAGTQQTLPESGSKKRRGKEKLSGTIPALCFAVFFADLDGRDLYSWLGGIEVLGMIEGESVVSVPADRVLMDAKRNQAAVDLALAPLEDKLGFRPPATAVPAIPEPWPAAERPFPKLGETRANTLLQVDAMQVVLTNDELADSTCNVVVFKDAKVTQALSGERLEGAMLVAGEWTELWTIDRCGTEVQYSLRFVADGKGGTNISPRRIP